MLTFEQKLAIIGSYPELERRDVSLGRVNFHYEASRHDKKTVVYRLHPNGNGYVYAGLLSGYPIDDKGYTNIRDLSEAELRKLLRASIDSLSASPARSTDDETSSVRQELWTAPDGQTLTVTFEDELWYIFTGLNLESACETYEEVEQYMAEEGCTRSR